MSTATDDNLQLREYVPQFTSTLNDPNIDDERKEKEITSLHDVLFELNDEEIHGLVTFGFVPPLLRVLIERGDTRETSSLNVLIQALIALTCITSSTVAAAVVEKKGVVLLLIRCLRRRDNPTVCRHAAASLTNIVLLGPETRDDILELGALEPTLEYIADHRFYDDFSDYVSFVRALCVVEPTPDKSLIEPAIETLWKIKHSDGPSILVKSYVYEALAFVGFEGERDPPEEHDEPYGSAVNQENGNLDNASSEPVMLDLGANCGNLEALHYLQDDCLSSDANESALGTTSPLSATTGDVIQIKDLEARIVVLEQVVARLSANRGTEINRAHGQEVDQNQPAI